MLTVDNGLFRKCLKFMGRIKDVNHLRTLTRQLKSLKDFNISHEQGVHSNHNKHIHNASLLNNN